MSCEGLGRVLEHVQCGLAVVDGRSPGEECEVRPSREDFCFTQWQFVIINGYLLDFFETQLSEYEVSDQQSDVLADLYKIFGSMNITGFGSRMELSKSPFACTGERGMTIY